MVNQSSYNRTIRCNMISSLLLLVLALVNVRFAPNMSVQVHMVNALPDPFNKQQQPTWNQDEAIQKDTAGVRKQRQQRIRRRKLQKDKDNNMMTTEDMDEDTNETSDTNNSNEQQQQDDGNGSTTNDNTNTTQEGGLVDLINLKPFSIQISVEPINMGIQIFEVSNILTDWLSNVYATQLEAFGYAQVPYTMFNSVVLFINDDKEGGAGQGSNRQLQQSNDNLFIAEYRGGVVFSRDTSLNRTVSVPENDVWVIQQNLLLYNDTDLLTLLQQSTDTIGLGDYVVNVNVYLNAAISNDDNNGNSPSSGSGTDGLDVVIIVAIVIAILAFLFLVGAIIWAYQYDRAHRDLYLINSNNNTNSSSMITDTKHKKKNGSNNSHSNLNDKTTSDSEDTTPDDIPGTPERDNSNNNSNASRSIIVEGNPTSVMMRSNGKKNDDRNVITYPTMIHTNGKSKANNEQEYDLRDGMDDNDDDGHYPESVISDSVVSGSALSEDVSTSLSQYYRAGMGGKVDYSRSNNGMLSDAGSVSSMESYGYSLADAGSISAIGIGMPIPTAISTTTTDIPSYLKDRGERIGGLPIHPDIVRSNSSKDDGNSTVNDETSDVQIPDLDKELSNLNIQLLPTFIGDVVDNDEDIIQNSNEQQYQMNDSTLSSSLKKLIGGIPKIVSTTSSRASSSAAASVAAASIAAASRTSSKASSSNNSKKSVPIDFDNALPDDDDDDDDDVPLPLLPVKTSEHTM